MRNTVVHGSIMFPTTPGKFELSLITKDRPAFACLGITTGLQDGDRVFGYGAPCLVVQQAVGSNSSHEFQTFVVVSDDTEVRTEDLNGLEYLGSFEDPDGIHWPPGHRNWQGLRHLFGPRTGSAKE
ncbi:MAG: hypothetical protein P4L53_23695 [Candidatus Obscuribacterales bacterium]|nr:hypothetical protein [Candidatus Obscuribacterales bacterium]